MTPADRIRRAHRQGILIASILCGTAVGLCLIWGLSL
jgi:hypothetical protein